MLSGGLGVACVGVWVCGRETLLHYTAWLGCAFPLCTLAVQRLDLGCAVWNFKLARGSSNQRTSA